MAGYVGLVALDDTIDKVVVSKNSSQVPTNADSLPTYRIYGPAGFLSSGSLSFKDTGSITGATNANPIVITSNGHNLTTGTKVTIVNVGGNTAANGTFDVTVLSSNTFSIPATGNGAYTSGGSWSVTGVYRWNFSPTVGANYEAGKSYSVVVYGLFSAASQIIDEFVFQVS